MDRDPSANKIYVKDLEMFANEVDNVKADMTGMKKLYAQVHESNEHIKSAQNAAHMRQLRDEVNADLDHVVRLAKQINRKFDGLVRANAAQRRAAGSGPGSSDNNAWASMISELGLSIKQMMRRFQGLRVQMETDHRQMIESRFRPNFKPMIKLFDSHCHLQDPRILTLAAKLITETLEIGVAHFAVNGVSEKDWHLVEQMSRTYPSVVPNFGLHPWFITERSPNWLITLKEFLSANRAAAVGEIGLDRGLKAKEIDFSDQVEVFRQQLQLAKEINRPASVHCVRAFGELLGIMESVGPFPSGVVLHSYLGSAEMVDRLSELGAYFSFSGFLMSLKESKAKRIVKSVPMDRILLETDAPDARPKSGGSLLLVEEGEGTEEESLNHPGNIRSVLKYVAGLLEMEEKDLAELSYGNAVRVFSYEGSKFVN